VRATLVKALPIIARIVGVDDDMAARGRAALTDPNPDIRIAMAFVMSQLGAKDGAAMLPELLALLKDPEAAVRGAAVVALRSFAADAAAKQKLREALRPLLKDRDAEVRWGALDTFHELDPAQDAALVAEIAALLKDEEQSVRAAAARTLGAAGAAAKPHLLDVIRFFNDDPAVPPYAAAEAVSQISPLTPQELTSLLSPLYVSPEQLPLVRLTAYAASGGDADGLLIVRLLGRSSAATKDVVKKADEARASALLEQALNAALVEDKFKKEINTRLAEVKAAQ
jgi:HEAT repeat protein